MKTINVSPERDLATIGEPFVEATINVVAYVFPFEYVPGQAQGNPQMQAGTQQPAGQQSAVVTGKTQTQKIAKVGGSKHE